MEIPGGSHERSFQGDRGAHSQIPCARAVVWIARPRDATGDLARENREGSAKLTIEHVPPPVPKPVDVLGVLPKALEVPVVAPPNGEAVEPKPR